MLNKYGEVADFFYPVNQFHTGMSTSVCGPYAVALCAYMGAPGQGPKGTIQAIDAWAKMKYEQYVGPDTASDLAGTFPPQLYQMLADAYLPFFVLDKTIDAIKGAIKRQRPVIVTVPESSLFDVDTGKVDYPWSTAGINHIVTITGLRADNALLVRDPANITPTGQRGPGPVAYDATKIGPLFNVVEVIPPWEVPPFKNVAPVDTVTSPAVQALKNAITPLLPLAKAINDIANT